MLETQAAQPAGLRTPDWYRSATRWTQLTLAEDDPVRYDPSFWLDVFKRTRSNATCLSAGGYIAYYPSKVPLHYVSKFIGDTDPFGTLVEGARRLGMHVMARVDPHAIHQDAADAHPEWVAHDRNGPRRHWAYPSSLGDLRLLRLQLQVHARGRARDRAQLRHRRGLRQSLAGPRRLLLRDLPQEPPRCHRPRPAGHRKCRGPRLSRVARLAPYRHLAAGRRVGRSGQGRKAACQLHSQHGRHVAHGVRAVS